MSVSPLFSKPIAYTIGEPAGIGADILIQYAQDHVLSDIVCIADRRVMQSRAKLLGLPLELIEYPTQAKSKSQITVLNQPFTDHTVIKEASISNVESVLVIPQSYNFLRPLRGSSCLS